MRTIFICYYTMDCGSRQDCGKCKFTSILNSIKQEKCKYAVRLTERNTEHIAKCEKCYLRFKCYTSRPLTDLSLTEKMMFLKGQDGTELPRPVIVRSAAGKQGLDK